MAHCGDDMGGSFVYSLVATDVCTGWTEAVPLLAREQSLVVAGLEAIAAQLPFPVWCIDSGNDGVFINDTLTEYCAGRCIEFTCSRAYRKKDQAWVEQKNEAVPRRFLGHERYSCQVAGQTIAHLYGAMRIYVHYFQPSFKLVEKTRNGSAVVKRYSSPAVNYGSDLTHLLRVGVDPPGFIAQQFCQYALCSPSPSAGGERSCWEGNSPACRFSLSL